MRFHAYGRNLAFQIYGDGNIAIELKEAFHADHVEQVFEYDADNEKQDAFIVELAGMAPCLIRVFIEKEVEDFHTYMDYVSDGNTAFEAYQRMKEDFRGYCEK